jgi:hypothetical protein
MTMNGGLICAVAAVAAVALSGCAGPDIAAPARAATAFAQAVSASDGALGCSLLSPEVQSQLAESAGTPCPAALLQEDLPAPSPVRQVERYGRQAFVVTATDTVFLSEFPDGWKIIGAGCQERGDKPYNCAVSGG